MPAHSPLLSIFFIMRKQRRDTQKELLNKLTFLIEEKKWNKTLKLLKKIKDVGAELGYNHNLLHKTCQYQAPLSIVKKMSNLFESHVRQPDKDRRLPFHIAIKNEAPIDVIEFLLKKNISAASSTDIDGNTPMHTLLLDYNTKIAEKNEKEVLTYDKYVHRVFILLCNVSSSSISHKNNNGYRAVDIAINKSVKPDMLVLMWNTDRYAMTEIGKQLVTIHMDKNEHKKQQRKASFTSGFTSDFQQERIISRRSTMWT